MVLAAPFTADIRWRAAHELAQVVVLVPRDPADHLFRLDGRVAVVIGAGSGIGQAAAKGLAAHGATVVCADLQREQLRVNAGQARRFQAGPEF